MHPKNVTCIIDRKKYSTVTATLIASDEYFDGWTWERNGRNQFLYRTPNGAYFTVSLTQWQGERNSLTPITQAEALADVEQLAATFRLIHPPVDIADRAVAMLRAAKFSGRHIYDVVLACTTLANGITRIYTYDERFRKMPGVTALTP